LKIWNLSGYSEKQRLQYLVFPEGMEYDRKKDTVRTKKVNSIFNGVAQLSKVLEGNKKGQTSNEADLSCQVGAAGFEPATSWSQTKRDTGLRYAPNNLFFKKELTFFSI